MQKKMLICVFRCACMCAFILCACGNQEKAALMDTETTTETGELQNQNLADLIPKPETVLIAENLVITAEDLDKTEEGYSYTICDDRLTQDSNISIQYKVRTGFAVAQYIQEDGLLTIVLEDIPENDIQIDSIAMILE